ncbi:MAG: hypothetical protein AB7W59_00545 [Acidimicrobiia bacterium]|nr:hypothetical protein [Acidimicrobiales bacterium]
MRQLDRRLLERARRRQVCHPDNLERVGAYGSVFHLAVGGRDDWLDGVHNRCVISRLDHVDVFGRSA